jgi:phosphoglycolate phosphatase
MLLDACQTAQVKPSETLIVGDSAADIALARAGQTAGCVGVNWGWTGRPSLPQADVVLTNIEQFEIVG